MVGYLCRSNPYQCIGSCYNQPNFTDASKVSCFNSCITGTTDSGNCPYINTDSLSGGGGIEFAPSVVDSVMAAFNQGFQGGVLTFIPIVGGAIAILIVIHLLSYGISKS